MIKLNNDKTYNEIFIQETGNLELTAMILAENLSYEDVESDFKNTLATEKISVLYGEEVVNVIEGYTHCVSLEKKFEYPTSERVEDVFFITLSQEDAPTKIANLGEKMKSVNNDVMFALAEVYEMILAQEV